MNRIGFIGAALFLAIAASPAEAVVGAYFSAGTDCSGPPTAFFQPAGPLFKVSLCTSSETESICGATVQLQAANAAESGRFRVIERVLATGNYSDPNSPFINWPVPITNPAQTTDFGGTVMNGNPPPPGPAQLVATFTMEALSTATNSSYVVSLTPISNTAIDGTDCFGAPYDIPISASLTLTKGEANPNPARLSNISTRLQVQGGSDVLIGGFVISGASAKTVVIRAIGPSLTQYGVTGALANPTLQLVRAADQSVVATNDDWQSASNAAQVQASGFAPAHPLESAIHATLPPGAYTAIVSGANGATGVGLIEVYEVDQPTTPLINISSRGKVGSGFDAMIGGFVITGTGSQTVVIRASGPSLAQYGIPGVLANPTMSLVRISDNTTIATNDDWQSASNAAQIQASGFAPGNPLESAILITLQPGAYTAVITGVNGGTGVGLIEVYKVTP